MGISIFVEDGANDDLLRKMAAKLLNELKIQNLFLHLTGVPLPLHTGR